MSMDLMSADALLSICSAVYSYIAIQHFKLLLIENGNKIKMFIWLISVLKINLFLFDIFDGVEPLMLIIHDRK